MAERRINNKGRGLIFEKPIPTKPRSSHKGKGTTSLAKRLDVIVISSSSSDYEEGFIEEISSSSSESTIPSKNVFVEKVTPSSSSSDSTVPPKKVYVEEVNSSSSKHTVCPREKSNQEVKLPPGAKLLMDCEAVGILQRINEKLGLLNSPSIKIPKSFEKALHYLKDVVHYTDVKSVKLFLEGLKKELKDTEWEICMLANTCPDTHQEAYALIPSFKDKKDWIDELETVLTTLATFKVVEFLF